MATVRQLRRELGILAAEQSEEDAMAALRQAEAGGSTLLMRRMMLDTVIRYQNLALVLRGIRPPVVNGARSTPGRNGSQFPSGVEIWPGR